MNRITFKILNRNIFKIFFAKLKFIVLLFKKRKNEKKNINISYGSQSTQRLCKKSSDLHFGQEAVLDMTIRKFRL